MAKMSPIVELENHETTKDMRNDLHSLRIVSMDGLTSVWGSGLADLGLGICGLPSFNTN